MPTPVSAENTLGDKAVIPVPSQGYTFVIATFPPDDEWDYVEGWADALADSGAPESLDSASTIPGLHATDAIDLVTIISGEIYAVTETGETLCARATALVQRGTKHAWSNRSNRAVHPRRRPRCCDPLSPRASVRRRRRGWTMVTP